MAMSVASKRSVARPAARKTRGSFGPSCSVLRIAPCPPHACISFADGGEKLAATGAAGRFATASHPPDRQKSKKNKMHERNQQPLGKGFRLLTGHTARERGAALRHESRYSRKGIGLEPHIGVKEDKQRMRGKMGEQVTRVLFAAPAGGQRWSALHAHAMVALRDFANNLARCDPSSRRRGRSLQSEHPCFIRIERTACPMFLSSLRAGMRTEHRAGPLPPIGGGL